MFVVTSTGWSPTLATLLLAMSTLQQPALLPTVQASVISDGTVPQMWRQPWILSMNTNRGDLTTGGGLLGKGSSDLPPDAQKCFDSVVPNSLFVECILFQTYFLDLVNKTHAGNPDYPTEYKCKALYCGKYCANLVASAVCLPAGYDALHKDSQQQFANSAQVCAPWASWTPPLDSTLRVTNEILACDKTIPPDQASNECGKDVQDFIKSQGITDVTELTCKTFFEVERCATGLVCKYCTASGAKEYLDTLASVWTPAGVECTKWASDKPKLDCSASRSTGGPASKPSPISPSDVCSSVTSEITHQCFDEAARKYPKDNEENRCKSAFYTLDCMLQFTCKHCTDSEIQEMIDLWRPEFDDLRVGCKEWSSYAPKLKCSSNTLMIVGIVLGVIALLVAIGVAVYCFCLGSDEPEPSYNVAGGGGGSRASSQINSDNAGSTMGTMQQSREYVGAKQQNHATGGVKQQNRSSVGAMQQSRASVGPKQQNRSSIGPKQQSRASVEAMHQKRPSGGVKQQNHAYGGPKQQSRASVEAMQQNRGSGGVKQQNRSSIGAKQQSRASVGPKQKNHASGGPKQQHRPSGGPKQQSRASVGPKKQNHGSGGVKQQSRVGAKHSSRA